VKKMLVRLVSTRTTSSDSSSFGTEGGVGEATGRSVTLLVLDFSWTPVAG